jgi:tellurite methyltransferase
MDIHQWNERYRSEDYVEGAPTPLLIDTASGMKPGRALDLACGTGRNAVWLAEHGWSVTAVDGSQAAIEMVRKRGPKIDARVADLEAGEYTIEPSAWDLIVMCLYLQHNLFEPVKRGVVPGGAVLALILMSQPGEDSTKHRVRPGELRDYFPRWEILYYHEGPPGDMVHQRAAAGIVARRLVS